MGIQEVTAEEQVQVDLLKSQLDEIKKEANVHEGYTLWGVPLNKESPDVRLDIILVKFLRARYLDVEKARKMLTDSLIWRKSFKADELLDEVIDDSDLKELSFIYKTDKEGRPVCYNFYGDFDQDKVFGDAERFIRWRVQVMERGVQLIDYINSDSMVVIHDYKGASFFGRSANAKHATKEIIKIMQDNYPEFLAVKFFVNIPFWGSLIFKLVRPLLSEATTKKFVVCSSDELYDTLTARIDNANLPDRYRKETKEIEQPKAEEIKAKEVKAEEFKAEEVKAEEVNAEEVKAKEVNAEKVKAKEVNAEEANAEEANAEKVNAEKVNAEKVKSDETK